jgi:putative transposase
VAQKLTEELLNRIVAAIEESFPKTNPKGRPRMPLKKIVRGIYFRLRTGTQWRYMPREYGAPSTLHTWMARLSKAKVMKRLWRKLVHEAKTEGRLKDDCCLLDASIIKAPLGGDFTGKSPVHRGRLGAKRSLLTDSNGMPLAILSSKANRNDRKLFVATLTDSVVTLKIGAILKMDKGYSGQEIREWSERKFGIAVNVPPVNNQKKHHYDISGRWKVERTFAWINAFRGLATRYERKRAYHDSLLHFWAVLIWGNSGCN